MNKLAGKKTYLVAVATLAYAVLGVYLGQLSYDQAAGVVLAALGLGALRNSIK